MRVADVNVVLLKLRITVSDACRVAVQCQWKLCVKPELPLQRETVLLCKPMTMLQAGHEVDN